MNLSYDTDTLCWQLWSNAQPKAPECDGLRMWLVNQSFSRKSDSVVFKCRLLCHVMSRPEGHHWLRKLLHLANLPESLDLDHLYHFFLFAISLPLSLPWTLSTNGDILTWHLWPESQVPDDLGLKQNNQSFSRKLHVHICVSINAVGLCCLIFLKGCNLTHILQWLVLVPQWERQQLRLV